MGGSESPTVCPSASTSPEKSLLSTTQGLGLNCYDELLQIHHLLFSFLSHPLVSLRFISCHRSRHASLYISVCKCQRSLFFFRPGKKLIFFQVVFFCLLKKMISLYRSRSNLAEIQSQYEPDHHQMGSGQFVANSCKSG